jgi:hypothetical protein
VEQSARQRGSVRSASAAHKVGGKAGRCKVGCIGVGSAQSGRVHKVGHEGKVSTCTKLVAVRFGHERGRKSRVQTRRRCRVSRFFGLLYIRAIPFLVLYLVPLHYRRFPLVKLVSTLWVGRIVRSFVRYRRSGLCCGRGVGSELWGL